MAYLISYVKLGFSFYKQETKHNSNPNFQPLDLLIISSQPTIIRNLVSITCDLTIDNLYGYKFTWTHNYINVRKFRCIFY